MLPLSEKNITAFQFFAVIFAVAELILLVDRFYLVANSIPLDWWFFWFDLTSAFLIPIVIIGETIIIAWERNKLLVNYFPYTVNLQDVGDHYGIAGDVISPESNTPQEEPFRILMRKRGSLGQHHLGKIVVETRPEFTADYAHEFIVPIKHESHLRHGDYVHHLFDFENSHLKEKQIETDFWIRRESGEGIMNHSEVLLKICINYRYRIFRHFFEVHEEFDVPSTISRRP